MLKNNPATAVSNLTQGAKLLCMPQFRPYILVPLIINVILFVILTGYLITNFNALIDAMIDFLPGWDWVKWLVNVLLWFIWPLFASLLMMVYGYTFNLITNLIAAPFYGMLAEKIENHLIGAEIESESLGEMIPRTLLRECLKLWYFISRSALLLVLSLGLMWIPLFNLLVPFLWLLWGAWSMAIQYSDYPADNHKTPFTRLRQWLGNEKLSSYSFGGLVMLAGMIPVVNIFAMPVAVAGATVSWVNVGKKQCLDYPDNSHLKQIS